MGSRIVIEWERATGRVDYQLEGLSHEEAQEVLLAVMGDNFGHAVMEVARRAYKEGKEDHGHEFHGHSDGG